MISRGMLSLWVLCVCVCVCVCLSEHLVPGKLGIEAGIVEDSASVSSLNAAMILAK